MKLYEHLNENVWTDAIDWKKYNNGEIRFIKDNDNDNFEDIGYIDDFELLRTAWEGINEWCTWEAENCQEDDAVLIARILNDTIRMISDSYDDTITSCSLYARCYMFVNHLSVGNDLIAKCRFQVNNAIANAILYDDSYTEITISDILNCEPDNDIWEDM